MYSEEEEELRQLEIAEVEHEEPALAQGQSTTTPMGPTIGEGAERLAEPLEQTPVFAAEAPVVAAAVPQTPAAEYAAATRGAQATLNSRLVPKPTALKLEELRKNPYALELHFQSVRTYVELVNAQPLLSVLFIETLDRELQAICREDLTALAQEFKAAPVAIPLPEQKKKLCKVVLHNVGGDPGVSTRTKWDRVRQQKGQSFVMWAAELRRLKQTAALTSDPFAPELTESDLKTKMVMASSDPSGLIARMKRDRFTKIPDIADIVTIGVQLEQEAQQRRPWHSKQGPVDKAGKLAGQPTKKEIDVAAVMTEGEVLKKKDREERRCFLCHQPGHFARECPTRSQ